MDKKKSVILAVVFLLIGLFFFVSDSGNKSGLPEDVLKANVGWSYDSFKKILELIEVNDEGDVLCVFETDEKIAVGYLKCVADDKYKFGTAVEFSPFWEKPEHYDVSNLKAGDSDLHIKFVVTYDDVEVKDSTQKYSFAIGGKNVALHIIGIENERCSGYEYYIEPNQS